MTTDEFIDRVRDISACSDDELSKLIDEGLDNVRIKYTRRVTDQQSPAINAKTTNTRRRSHTTDQFNSGENCKYFDMYI
jgi:hypothetical protein